MKNLSLSVAFLAGIVSFFSPCIIPMVPAFLAYLAGVSLQEIKTRRRDIFLNSFFFVLGFSAVFSLLGVVLNGLLSAFSYNLQSWLAKIGGLLIIFFGLIISGLVKIPFLEKEHKIKLKLKTTSRYPASFIFGASFALGWTPCVGAVLGAILGLAAATPGSALLLLFTYSMGLGLPFLLVGLFTIPASVFIQRYAASFKYLNLFFGIILIILGILMFTNNLKLIYNLF